MQNTLEVRWFVEGIPPAVVQRWFKLECPGELLEEEPEIREDLYAYQQLDNGHKTKMIDEMTGQRLLSPHLVNYEEINLKMREGNLELKLRKQKLGTQQFGNAKNPAIWLGNIERWYKLNEEELTNSDWFTPHLISKTGWISVYKKREQRVELGVESELTWLRVNGDRWWSVAFEMAQNSNETRQVNIFKQSVDRACQTYCGPKLSVENSYSYGYWISKYASSSKSFSN